MKRLGSNISDILAHPYFGAIDWDLLLKKKITPPWKPKLVSDHVHDLTTAVADRYVTMSQLGLPTGC